MARMTSTERVRAHRLRERRFEQSLRIVKPLPEPPAPGCEWQAVSEWAKTLKVPSGPLTGKPFMLPPWQESFLRGALAPGIREAGLSVARKNGKSGLIAVLLLAYLVGPLAKSGFRGIVCSLTGRLALELWMAMEGICRASNLQGVAFKRTPMPGIAIADPDQRIDFLAADKATGHALGADVAIIDEAGLIPESGRSLWNAILSSISGRDGRLICISIRGDGPMFSELAERADDRAVHWTEYAGNPHWPLDNKENWLAANPGLTTGIKSLTYMDDMSRRALANPNNQALFAAYDLNLPQEPSRELILSVSDWQACITGLLPPREGICCLGMDIGGSSSMTAAVAYWPTSGRLEVWGAFPAVPDLRARGDADGVGGLYQRMKERHELSVYPGRVTDVVAFIDDCASRLAGEQVICALDRYRKAEALTAFERAGVIWQLRWRGQGHSHTADGSADVRAFQKLCLSGKVQSERSLMLESAIAASSIVRDPSGNPKLDKGRQKGRIDALQAGVLALGLGSRMGESVGRIYHGVI